MGARKSIEEVQQILKRLGKRQTISSPVFESSGQIAFHAEIKAKILQYTPSTWYGILIFMLSPAMGKDIMILIKSLLMWGIVTNPGNGYRLWEIPKTKKELKKLKGYPKWL